MHRQGSEAVCPDPQFDGAACRACFYTACPHGPLRHHTDRLELRPGRRRSLGVCAEPDPPRTTRRTPQSSRAGAARRRDWNRRVGLAQYGRRSNASAGVGGARHLLFAFLLLLIQPQQVGVRPRAITSLALVALVLLASGFAAQTLVALDLDILPTGARLAALTSMALSIFGLVLVEQMFLNVAQDSRWNAKPICVALAGSFTFDLYVFSQAVIFDKVDVDAYSIRGAVHALMAPLLMISSTRRRDWISKLRVSRSAAFHSATLLICGAYLIFISSVGYYVRFFGGEWGRALQLGLVFLSLILLTILALSGTVRAKLRVFLNKHFFRYRYDYREEWLKFTRTLCAQNTPQEMGQQVIRGLADLVESPGGGLWMKSPGSASFRQTARLNMAARHEPEDAASPLCRFLCPGGIVINMDEYRSSPERYENMTLPSWLQSLATAWLIVPLVVGDELIGFVVLLSARTQVDPNWEVYDLLKTASRQAASFLAQMVATEALLEVRKFDAFNRMSAFVVHDLKNIVTQLSLMMKNAKRLHANPEFQQDMLMTVENSLERMRQLMAQLREGTTPAGATFGVDLAGVVRRIESVALGRGRRVDVQVSEPVTARGHEERLERIIGHVVQNALDATDPSGQVWLHVDRLGGQARIEIGDTGQGMSPEFVRDRLFKPFQTTKPTGMGIGAYESFQYVQELGGKISVQSEPDKGTQVTMLVPIFDARTESDLDLLAGT
ncbi:MAG: PEP-CTERM system histidine kinase PrsK [Betaproteobacteria bacterium]|nr:MAG: PEP-CTERM system histidine kinase PrsK [Betaproteobacteria bacterium]